MYDKIIVIILNVIIIILFLSIFYVETKNIDIRIDNILVPFQGYYKFDGNGDPIKNKLLRTDGENQINCPSDKKINILYSRTDVYDPYGETWDGKHDTLKIFKVLCTKNPDNPTSDNFISCGDPLYNLGIYICGNINSSYKNIIFPASNCKSRQSVSYLSKKCNGKITCEVEITPDFFGPYPCSIFTKSDYSSNNMANDPCLSKSNYYKFPMLPGNPGTSSSFTDAKYSNPTTVNQGYYVHGLYSCI